MYLDITLYLWISLFFFSWRDVTPTSLEWEETMSTSRRKIFSTLQEYVKEPMLCGYIVFIYPKLRVYINFQFIYSNGKGILWFFFTTIGSKYLALHIWLGYVLLKSMIAKIKNLHVIGKSKKLICFIIIWFESILHQTSLMSILGG